jgi:cytochrome c biogenesis protein CcdA/thiol-disulfide isomerase/thioredoxin
MALLLVFALIAGAGTAVTPCVLPVLPALLSAGSTGGRRRPLGIVVGLGTTFTVAIVGLASVIDGVGVAHGGARTLAVIVLGLFGIVVLAPPLADRIEAPLSRLTRYGPKSRGSGFFSGLIVGGALGFLYAPCAGPILAAVVSVSASQGGSLRIFAVAAAYATGSATVLLLLSVGGRRVIAVVRAAGGGPTIQRALGVVMIATAVVMATNLDVRFQTALADHFPSFLVNPTKSLETSHAAEKRLAELRGRPRFDSSHTGETASLSPMPGRRRKRSSLPDLGAAPNFTGTQRWFNTGGHPLDLHRLRGKVVLVDFWTYTCINCIRTLPYVKAWYGRYGAHGFVVVGVHTPEFDFEKDADNVVSAIRDNGLRYPVVQDNDYTTWNAYGNQYWPAKYLIDAQGQVRYTHFGEGGYGKTEAAIRSLLEEAQSAPLGARSNAHAETPSAGVQTPETYLGYARSQGSLPGPVRPGLRRYRPLRGQLRPSHFTLGGLWDVSAESAAAAGSGATLRLRFVARRVYLVLSSTGGQRRSLRVRLDGRSVRAGEAGRDVAAGVLAVQAQRLYRVVDLPRVEDRVLELRFTRGIAGYAFTFG